MSVRGIATVGHPVLRERAQEVSEAELPTPAVQDLIDEMIDTMRAANGAGLAANQVHDLRRIAVVEVRADNPRYPYKPPIPLTVMVNPELEPVGQETIEINEGCLSVPDLRGTLERHAAVRVRYLDRDGEPHEEIHGGLSAGTFQHEVDHLDGVLFLDRVRDPSSFSTWEQFQRHHGKEWAATARAIEERFGRAGDRR